MRGIVCDCSVTAAWCLRDESNPQADGVLSLATEAEFLVPSIWAFEMANVLVAAERRGRIQPGDSEKALAAMRRLPLRVVAADAALPLRLLTLSRSSGLSAYDAAYLQLALDEGLPLATLDRELIAAAGDAGVALIPAS